MQLALVQLDCVPPRCRSWRPTRAWLSSSCTHTLFWSSTNRHAAALLQAMAPYEGVAVIESERIEQNAEELESRFRCVGAVVVLQRLTSWLAVGAAVVLRCAAAAGQLRMWFTCHLVPSC